MAFVTQVVQFSTKIAEVPGLMLGLLVVALVTLLALLLAPIMLLYALMELLESFFSLIAMLKC